MAEFFDTITDKHKTFIEQQHLFFVGTAAQDGRVNVSPKGMDSLKILSPQKIIWLNLTGSGNETAAHVQQVNRITLMWCSYDKTPLILRVYGEVNSVHKNDSRWNELINLFTQTDGARQVFEVSVSQVQTSCGFAVPYYEFIGHRDTLKNNWQKKGNSVLPEYWQSRNATSIDGFDTGMTQVIKDLS